MAIRGTEADEAEDRGTNKPRTGRRCENVQDKISLGAQNSLSRSQEKAGKLEPRAESTADQRKEEDRKNAAGTVALLGLWIHL